MVQLSSQMPIKALLVNEFCEAFRISRASVYRLLRAKKLNSFKLQGRRLIPSSEAQRILDQYGN